MQKEPSFSNRSGSAMQKEPSFSIGGQQQKEPDFQNEPSFPSSLSSSKNRSKTPENQPELALGVQKMSLVQKKPSFSQQKKAAQSQPAFDIAGSSGADGADDTNQDEPSFFKPQAEPTASPSKPPVSFGGVKKPASATPAPDDYIRKLNQYKLLKEIGKGSFGKVYEAINDNDKIIYVSSNKDESMVHKFIIRLSKN